MSRLVKIFIPWGASVLLAACQPPAEIKDRQTVVEGQVDFPSDSVVYYYAYRDSVDYYLHEMSPLDSEKLDSTGSFSFTLPVTSDQVFSIRLGSRDLLANMYIGPGDHLEFRFRGPKHHPRVEPIGRAARFNAYLIQFQDSFYRDKEAYKMYYIVANFTTPDEFASYTEDRRQHMHAHFDAFFEGDTPRSAYRDYAYYTIEYEFGCDRLMYLWKKRMKGEEIHPDTSYFSFLTQGFIENPDALVAPSYIRFLNLYLNQVFEDKAVHGGYLVEGKTRWLPAVEKYKLADSLFSLPIKNVVLYDLFYNDLQDVAERDTAQTATVKNLDSLRATFLRKYGLQP